MRAHAALPAVPMPAAVLVPAAVTAVAAVIASPAAALRTGTDSRMGPGLQQPETLQWRLGAEEEEDVALAQPPESAACVDAPAVLAAVHEGGFEHGRSGLEIARRCHEPASAEQNLAVHAAVHAAGPAAVLAAVLAAVQAAVLPAALAAGWQQLLVQQLCL